jgi:hypothetical protein
VPTEWASTEGVKALADLTDPQAIRETLGGSLYDEHMAHLAANLHRLNVEQRASEKLARPVRRILQSGVLAKREALQRDMAQHGVSERDLCSAWHHIPRERRDTLNNWLRSHPENKV